MRRSRFSEEQIIAIVKQAEAGKARGELSRQHGDTGQTYYRQVMVEQTGFTYDIMLNVYDGRTGSLVFEQPLKDFQEKPERNFDEFTGMFSNLFALENQLIGIFVPRTVKTKRVLFTP